MAMTKPAPHHRCGKDRAYGVGHSLTGDIGGRPVDRLKDGGILADVT